MYAGEHRFEEARALAQALVDRNPREPLAWGSLSDALLELAMTKSQGSLAMGWLRLGLSHILTGYDHLVLLALLLVTKTLRSLIRIVSAFTVAHSLSLGATALGFLAPSASLVEPAIALSVACVGFETLLSCAPRRSRSEVSGFNVHSIALAIPLAELAPRSGKKAFWTPSSPESLRTRRSSASGRRRAGRPRARLSSEQNSAQNGCDRSSSRSST